MLRIRLNLPHRDYEEARTAVERLTEGTATIEQAVIAWHATRTSGASRGLSKGWLSEALSRIEARERGFCEPGLLEVVSTDSIGNHLTSRWYAGDSPIDAAEATCAHAAKHLLTSVR